MWRGWPIVLVACGRVSFDNAPLIDAADAFPGDPALLAYWSFEDSGGDASGHGHDATLVSAGYAPGFRGLGLSLTGGSSYALVPSVDASLLGGGSFTISLCVNVPANLGVYDMPFYVGGGDANDSGVDFELGTGSWATSIEDGDGVADAFLIVGPDTLAGTGWHCLASRVDRATRNGAVFLDGAIADNGAATSLNPFPPANTLRFGGNTLGLYPFAGGIDEVRIYTRALSDTEIVALHTPP